MAATITRRQQSRQLGYAEITSNASVTNPGATVAGLVLSNLVIPADRPVEVEFWCGIASHSSVNGTVTVWIVDGGVTTSYSSAKITSATANATGCLIVKRVFAAGTCPTSVAAWAQASAAGGTLQAAVGSGFGPGPCYIRATAL